MRIGLYNHDTSPISTFSFCCVSSMFNKISNSPKPLHSPFTKVQVLLFINSEKTRPREISKQAFGLILSYRVCSKMRDTGVLEAPMKYLPRSIGKECKYLNPIAVEKSTCPSTSSQRLATERRRRVRRPARQGQDGEGGLELRLVLTESSFLILHFDLDARRDVI
ncbi:Uncharacterized protein HZ326_16048 [Fusarium oxysporum f. sp. albedinis]|nr:Uncharacterized protein HZ326_16048 [Fusarium oxysporum f. sp. albedinis]